MNKHLFVIFLSLFSCQIIAGDFPGAVGWYDKTTISSAVVPEETGVVVGCGFYVTVKDLASASCTPHSSPELERRNVPLQADELLKRLELNEPGKES